MRRKTMRHRLRLAATLAAAGLMSADEARPHRRFTDLVRTFPAPSAERAYDCEGTLHAGDVEAGSFRFSARVVSDGGADVWELTDAVESHTGTATLRQTHVARLSRTFEPLSGRVEVSAGAFNSVYRWQREGTAIAVVAEVVGKDPVRTRGAFPGSTLSGIASTLLFARLAMPMDEILSVPVWDVTQIDAEGSPPRPMALRCSSASDGSVVTHRVTGVVHDAQFTYDFDATGAFLGGRHTVSAEGNEVQFQYRVK